MKESVVVIVSMLLALILVSTIGFNTYAAEATKAKKTDAKPKKEAVLPVPEVAAGGAVVMSASTSQVVFDLHKDRKLQPGKLTRLMTAMIVIDNMHSKKEFNTKIEVTQEMASADENLPAIGSKVTIDELLYHMLANNSDVATKTLIDYSASSQDVFINMMNSKVVGMELMNTQFANATGDYNANQYSTAADMAVIVQQALRYEHIKDIIMDVKTDIDCDFIKGSFTSYMKEPETATQVVGISNKDDMILVTVLLSEPEKNRQADVKALTAYAYSKVKMDKVFDAGKKVGTAKVKGGERTFVKAYTSAKGYAYIPPEGSKSLLRTEVVMDKDLQAPLKMGAKVGEYQIFVADELVGTVDLITKKEVKPGWFPSKFYISNLAVVIIVAIFTLIVLIFARAFYVASKRKKLYELRRREKIRQIAAEQKAKEEERRRRGWDF